MVTESLCWRLFSLCWWFFSMYEIGRQHLKSVTNIFNLSPTHVVSNICHQYRCHLSRFDEKTGSKPYKPFIDYIFSDVNVKSLDWDFIPTPSRRFFKILKIFRDFSCYFNILTFELQIHRKDKSNQNFRI